MGKRKAPQASASAASGAAASAPVKKARFSNPPPRAAAPSAAAPPPKSKKAQGKAAQAAAEPVARTPEPPKRFVVASGSYERLLYGLECSFQPATKKAAKAGADKGYALSIEPVFSFPAHLSSVRTVAASHILSPGTGSERKVGGKYLVSAGTDEVIKVWDLRRRKEMGSLEGDTTGTINCMRFVPQRNMLMVASSDSTIALYRVRDFVLLRALKGHKGRVNAMDAHPDGRVALSVGVDRMLRMWDLVAGKSVASLQGDVVRWNTNGSKFAVICNNELTVYGLDMSIHHQMTAKSRFQDVRFCHFPLDAADPAQREYLCVACEDGRTRVFDISNPTPVVVDEATDLNALDLPKLEPVALLAGHTNRVKMIDLLEVALPTAEPSTTIVLTTASSDGFINFYDLADVHALVHARDQKSAAGAAAGEVEPIGRFDTDKSRLTCVCAIGLVERAAGSKSAAQGDEDDDSEESDSEEEDEDEDDDESEEGSGAEELEEDEFAGFEDEEEEE
ncbi:Protein mak11 [Rhodotorula sphaerocarpa]